MNKRAEIIEDLQNKLIEKNAQLNYQTKKYNDELFELSFMNKKNTQTLEKQLNSAKQMIFSKYQKEKEIKSIILNLKAKQSAKEYDEILEILYDNKLGELINEQDIKQNESLEFETDTKKIHNNWTQKSVLIVDNWIKDISKSSFIYDIVQEKYKSLSDNFLIVILIFSTITTILAGINSALEFIEIKWFWLSFSFDVAVLVLQSINTILTGIIKIKGWSNISATLMVFVEKLDNFYSIISNQISLPTELRNDAISFIKEQNKEYLNIKLQSPNLLSNDYRMATSKYNKFLAENHINLKNYNNLSNI